MRQQAIKTLERRFRPPTGRVYGVRFSDDDPDTIRVLPSEWTDPEDTGIGIHRPISTAGMGLERVGGNFMNLLKDRGGGDANRYAWASVFRNFGLLYDSKELGEDGMELYRINIKEGTK